MADPINIKYAEELLQRALLEWRDAGGPVEIVTGSILRLIVAREEFAAMVAREKGTLTQDSTGKPGESRGG